jgi:hypothetical protein
MTELEKMLAGELYDPMDAELVARRDRARELCWKLNAKPAPDRDVLAELFGKGGATVWKDTPLKGDDAPRWMKTPEMEGSGKGLKKRLDVLRD